MNRKKLLLFTITIFMTFSFGCTNGTAEAFLSEENSTNQSSEVLITLSSEPNSQAYSDITSEERKESESVTEQEILPPITLGFSGDINFDENWCTMQTLNASENGLYDCIDEKLMSLTNSFTLFMTNNEFTYSNRGEPMNGKAYTFRARPERIDLLKLMGTDLVLLANNHIFDYGTDAFEDTLDTLDANGIDRVGAGRTATEATAILYYTYDNITIAYTAATRAEKNIMTPEATDSSSGVYRCYDYEPFLSTIKTAAGNSDYVVACVHWGTEYSNDYTSTQQEMAHAMIDAGANTVIGTHPHVLQGIEYYKEQPIFYSLGNYWFNEKTLYSGLAELSLNPSDASLESVRFYPAIQSDCKTKSATKEEATEIYDFLTNLSSDILIDDSGLITSVN